MGSCKTKAMAELIDEIEGIIRYYPPLAEWQVKQIMLRIEDFRREFHGPKQQAAKEKKAVKRRRRLSE